MSRGKLRNILYILAASITIVSFQNCGAGFESIEILESNIEKKNINNEEEILVIDQPEIVEQPEVVIEEPAVVVEEPEVVVEEPAVVVEEPVVPEIPVVEEIPPSEMEISTGGNCSGEEQIFMANDSDTIVIEAESTKLVGKWEKRGPTNGSSGPGIIVYRRSESPNDRSHNYDGVSELVYNVFVNKAGVYNFSYRGARYKGSFNYTVFGAHDNTNCPSSKKDCTHADLNNDAFVSTSNGLAPTKLFAGVGNSTDSWKTASTFDANHKKSKAQVNLKAGVNQIFIRGRSTFFAIDKIFIFKGNQPNNNTSQSIIGCK